MGMKSVVGRREVRAKTKKTATSHVCGSEVLSQWADGYSCALFGDEAGLCISVPSRQLFVGMHCCTNARDGCVAVPSSIAKPTIQSCP